MKYLIASDIHGSYFYVEKLKEVIQTQNPDKVLLLGDLYYHGPRNPLPQGYDPKAVCEYFNSIKEKLIVVQGNCDAEVDQMISQFKIKKHCAFKFCGKNIFATHGHKYDKENLPNKPFDIMFYGHFHTGFIEQKDGKIIANPGSISLPKNNTTNSYIILTEKQILLMDFDGNIVDKKDI